MNYCTKKPLQYSTLVALYIVTGLFSLYLIILWTKSTGNIKPKPVSTSKNEFKITIFLQQTTRDNIEGKSNQFKKNINEASRCER